MFSLTMRRVLGWVGYAIGPLAGGLYWLLLKILNGGRSLEVRWAAPIGETEQVWYVVTYNARGVKGAVTFVHHIWTEYSETQLRPLPGARLHRLLEHEIKHIPQWLRLGRRRFLSIWFSETFQHGHDGNRLERECIDAAGV